MSELASNADGETLSSGRESGRGRGGGRWLAAIADPARPALVYVGVTVTLVGFALVMLAWSDVAGETNVAFQLPYLVSAGFTGLGLIMTGLLVVNIAVKRRAAVDRARQTAQLAEALRELRHSMDQQ